MKNQTPISFKSGTRTLQGVLHMPEAPNPPLVVGSHGLEGTMNSAKQTLLAEILPAGGIAFLRFDHRGCGSSQGDFLTDTSLDKRVADMTAAVRHALDMAILDGRVGLFGSSLGGSTAVETWHRLKALNICPAGIVVCAALIQSRTIETIPLGANERRGPLPMSFFENNLLFDLTARAEALKNILIFHGDHDRVVPLKNGETLFRLVKEPKKMIVHKMGDHRMSSIRDQKEFARESLAWYRAIFRIK